MIGEYPSDLMKMAKAIENSTLLETDDLFLGASPEEDGMVFTFMRREKEIGIFVFETPYGWLCELFDSPEL